MLHRSCDILLVLIATTLLGCSSIEPFPPTRCAPGSVARWIDLRAVVHVHTEASEDANGSIDEIVGAARAVGVDAVLVTDHDSRAQQIFEGEHEGVLVIVGEEKGGRGHLLAFGHDESVPRRGVRREVIASIHASGGLAFTAHPFLDERETLEEELALVDGLEIYSLSTDTLPRGALTLFFDIVFGLTFAPHSTLNAIVTPQRRALDAWDRTLATRPCVGLGGVDSHGTYGFSHEEAFRVVQTHFLVERCDAQSVIEAMRRGRCYVTFEREAPVPFFTFECRGRVRVIEQGGEGRLAENPVLHVRLPQRARIELRRDGEVVLHHENDRACWPVTEPGVYRVEVWRSNRLWIVSNPIRIR